MSIDALRNSVSTLQADVTTLINSKPVVNGVPQADVDAVQVSIDALDVQVKAAIPPAV